MTTPREEYLHWKAESEKEQLDATINNPNLTPEELWRLTESNFHQWRKKYDYPVLLKSLSDSVPSFNEWKNLYGITDEVIMDCSLTDFINPKKLSKDKFLYLHEQTFDGKKRLLVCYSDLSKVKSKSQNIPNHILY